MPLKKDTSKRLEEWKTGRMEPENKDGRVEDWKNGRMEPQKNWKIGRMEQEKTEIMEQQKN